MPRRVLNILQALFDAVLPPRPTERVVRALTIEALQALAVRGGRYTELPYHDPTIMALVWELKYYANKKAARLAGKLLSEELLAIAEEEIGTILLIPVPMHRRRRHERGHNQTEVLCKATLSYLSHSFIYRPDVLVRVRNTPQQQGLEKHERLKNVYDSMRVIKPGAVTNRICVVVDDVTTTGATLSEAKRALKEAGASKVICIALAQS